MRHLIFVHAGNKPSDSAGFILVARRKSTTQKEYVEDSKSKVKELIQYIQKIGIEKFKVKISNDFE